MRQEKEGRLRNLQGVIPVSIVEQNLVVISNVMLVLFYLSLGMHMTRHRVIM